MSVIIITTNHYLWGLMPYRKMNRAPVSRSRLDVRPQTADTAALALPHMPLMVVSSRSRLWSSKYLRRAMIKKSKKALYGVYLSSLASHYQNGPVRSPVVDRSDPSNF